MISSLYGGQKIVCQRAWRCCITKKSKVHSMGYLTFLIYNWTMRYFQVLTETSAS